VPKDVCSTDPPLIRDLRWLAPPGEWDEALDRVFAGSERRRPPTGNDGRDFSCF